MLTKLDWEMISEISSLLCDLDHRNVIDISVEELALLLSSIFEQVSVLHRSKGIPQSCWESVLKKAYVDVGWEGCEPSEEIIKQFQSNFLEYTETY